MSDRLIVIICILGLYRQSRLLEILNKSPISSFFLSSQIDNQLRRLVA